MISHFAVRAHLRQRHRQLVNGGKRCLSLAYALHKPPELNAASQGTPIVILHGLFGSKQNNRGISKVLARDLGVPVYAVDLRNHGDSPHHEEHTYLAMAADIEQFLKEHSLQSVCLIGHSMGAKVAMTLAIQAPGHVASLISVDNAPVDAMLRNDFHKYVVAMRKILDHKVMKQSEADMIFREVEDSLPIRQFLLTNVLRDPNTKRLIFRIPVKILGNALSHMGDFPYKDPHSHNYKGKTLMVRGTRSHYVTDEALPLIGQFFPTFRLVDIDSGHWVISEQPEAFRKAVTDFLTSGKDD